MPRTRHLRAAINRLTISKSNKSNKSIIPVTRCDVKTFPPTTAAVGDGLRMLPVGIRIEIGVRHP